MDGCKTFIDYSTEEVGLVVIFNVNAEGVCITKETYTIEDGDIQTLKPISLILSHKTFKNMIKYYEGVV